MLHHEAVGIGSFISVPWQLALPVWRHEAGGVPPLFAPLVHDRLLLEHHMIDPGARKPIARRQSGLPPADDDGAITALDLLLRAHLASPSRTVSQATRASSCPSNCVAVASMRASWPSASEYG